jgi:hypothetical protein
MSYVRVIPRDLFNEGDLLKCLGKLWIRLDDRRGHRAEMHGPTYSDGFEVDQDPADGSIAARNVHLTVDGRPHRLYRPLNSRSPWPLWASAEPDDLRVFNEEGDGDLSPEFLAFIGWRA